VNPDWHDPARRMFCQATGFGGTTKRKTIEDKLAESANLPDSVKSTKNHKHYNPTALNPKP